jgi:hypothetical protein
MSFRDFEKGITQSPIRLSNPRLDELAMLTLFKESEHVLGILRSFNGKRDHPDEEAMKRWLKRIQSH